MSLQTINTPRDTTFQSTETTPRNIADVLADELSGIASEIANIGSSDYDDLTNKPQVNGVTLSGNKSSDDLSLAAQSDLTSIKATGTTNATGANISTGTYFYLNGTLCQAKADIATGATFTLNTNYEVVTAGGLNSLNSALIHIITTLTFTNGKATYSLNGVTSQSVVLCQRHTGTTDHNFNLSCECGTDTIYICCRRTSETTGYTGTLEVNLLGVK